MLIGLIVDFLTGHSSSGYTVTFSIISLISIFPIHCPKKWPQKCCSNFVSHLLFWYNEIHVLNHTVPSYHPAT